MPLTIGIVTPAPRGSRSGNRITALRWAGLLRQIGHRPFLQRDYDGRPCDVLVALHARRSAAAVQRSRREMPERPVVVALTGTDIFADLPDDPDAAASVRAADRLVCLQPAAVVALPAEVRGYARVIYQSALPLADPPAPRSDRFDVCLLAHLRPVKNPFLLPRALALLPATSRIHAVHAGRALDEDMRREAVAWTTREPRYRWIGEVPRRRALELIACSRLLVVTSGLEGAANVISEALAAGVPVVSSAMAGAEGMLGASYPGLFPLDDAPALAALLDRIESESDFCDGLERACVARAARVEPARERMAWRDLLAELVPSGSA